MPTTFAAYIGEGRVFDRLTRLVSNRNGNLPKSSHLELLSCPLPAPSALCISASKRDGFQVRTKRIDSDPEHWRFWTFPDMDNVDAWRLANLYLGDPYDLRGAILSVTPFARSGVREIFCSEQMGIVCDFPDPHRLTPSGWERLAIAAGAEMTVLEATGGRPCLTIPR